MNDKEKLVTIVAVLVISISLTLLSYMVLTEPTESPEQQTGDATLYNPTPNTRDALTEAEV